MLNRFLSALGIAALASYQSDARPPGILPDPVLTPGDTLPVTANELCVTQSDLQHRRHWSREQSDRTLKRYRLPAGPYGNSFEQDHLIPICMSGSDDEKNLWMQPRSSLEPVWNAERKDKLEAAMCQMICSGQIDLHVAQEAIRTNWIQAYRKYVGEAHGGR